MKRSLTFLLAIALVGLAVLATAPNRARVLAQNRMNYLARRPEQRPRRARPGDSQAGRLRHVHAGSGASRRRDQRAVRHVHPWHGPALDRPAEQPRRRRTERNRPGAVPRHGRAAHRRTALGAPHRRRRAVFHARHRLRLFVRPPGSDPEMGPRGHRRRLRAAAAHAAPRRRPDHEHSGPRRRPRA